MKKKEEDDNNDELRLLQGCDIYHRHELNINVVTHKRLNNIHTDARANTRTLTHTPTSAICFLQIRNLFLHHTRERERKHKAVDRKRIKLLPGSDS